MFRGCNMNVIRTVRVSFEIRVRDKARVMIELGLSVIRVRSLS